MLSERLERYPVVFAYLFGSHAAGRAASLSDIDIAVYLEKGVDKPQRFDLRLRLSSELSSVAGIPADVIVINDSPLSLAYEAIKHGKVLLCKDREQRIEVETKILSRYLDRRYYDRRRAAMILEQAAKGPVGV